MYCNAATEGPSHGRSGSAEHFVKIGPVVPEICSQTNRHTDNLIAIHRSPATSSNYPQNGRYYVGAN